ncbi:MAG: anion permease [Clostridia bacterium]|nr:anion permease [Clostridia bacterium]
MKKYIKIAIAALFMFFFRYLPIDIGLSADAMQMLGIFIGAIILWLTVAIDYTSVLVLFALCLLPGVSTADVLQNSLGNSTIAFLIFSFMLTYALSETGFLSRCALFFINNSFAKKSIWRFIFMYFAAILVIGSFIAPTVVFLLFFALAKEIYEMLGLKKGDPTAKVMMIGTAIITSISCAMTPIAHTFPLMALGYYEAETGLSISYLDYLKIGIPVGIALFALTFMVLYTCFKKRVSSSGVTPEGAVFENKGKMSGREIFSLVVFILVVICWISTGIFPKELAALNALGTSVPAMVGVVLLCAVNIGGKPVMQFRDAITKGVSWSSIMLCAATLAVGKYLTSAEFGITSALSGLLTPVFGDVSVAVMLLIVVGATIIMTNLMSNIVTTTVMYNIVSPVIGGLMAIGVGLPLPIATIVIGMSASLAYATPPAIAHIAIAAGSEWATPKDMLKYGGVMSILSIAIVWAVSLIFV